jgi:hypothetical protein
MTLIGKPKPLTTEDTKEHGRDQARKKSWEVFPVLISVITAYQW